MAKNQIELNNSDYLKLGHLVVEFLQQPSPLADAVRKVINLQPVGKDLVVSPLEDMIDNASLAYLLNISPRTLQTLRDNGSLPFYKIGGKIYYRRSEVFELMKCHDVKLYLKAKKDGKAQ